MLGDGFALVNPSYLTVEEDDWKTVCRKTARTFDEGELEIEHGQVHEALSDERDRNRYALMKMGIGWV